MLKKLFLSIAIIFLASASIATVAFAEDSKNSSDENSSNSFNSYVSNSCEGSVLGFTTWNCGVNISDDTTLKTGIWQIAANIANDIAVAAAYLVLGYVIYGGYLYTFSGGDPGKVATGRKTLAQAFIGLAIVMSANLIMSTIRIALLGSRGSLGNCLVVNEGLNNVTGNCVDATAVVTHTINWFIAIAGIVSAIFVVYGGISYITSVGDPNKLKKAKDMILYSLIGLAIVALASVITAFVSNMIREANENANVKLINDTHISKEVYETKIS